MIIGIEVIAAVPAKRIKARYLAHDGSTTWLLNEAKQFSSLEAAEKYAEISGGKAKELPDISEETTFG
jgi:hypothetical protein